MKRNLLNGIIALAVLVSGIIITAYIPRPNIMSSGAVHISLNLYKFVNAADIIITISLSALVFLGVFSFQLELIDNWGKITGIFIFALLCLVAIFGISADIIAIIIAYNDYFRHHEQFEFFWFGISALIGTVVMVLFMIKNKKKRNG